MGNKPGERPFDHQEGGREPLERSRTPYTCLRSTPVGVFICRTFIGTQAIELRRRAREALVEMHIAFQRTGGFAGIRNGGEINTENLSPEEATPVTAWGRSGEHTSELQSPCNLVC